MKILLIDEDDDDVLFWYLSEEKKKTPRSVIYKEKSFSNTFDQNFVFDFAKFGHGVLIVERHDPDVNQQSIIKSVSYKRSVCVRVSNIFRSPTATVLVKLTIFNLHCTVVAICVRTFVHLKPWPM